MRRDEAILQFIEEHGIIRPRDLDEIGVSRQYLHVLYEQNRVERIGRGLYTLPEHDFSAHASLAETAKRVPNGVVCLLSALNYYEIGTQLPFEVWLAIEGTSWMPQVDYPPLRVMRFSGEAYTYGIETHTIENVPVKIYSIAKTVADTFKYRYKIGLDVALEALKDVIRNKRCTVDDIWRASKICRVKNVIRPYIEALV